MPDVIRKGSVYDTARNIFFLKFCGDRMNVFPGEYYQGVTRTDVFRKTEYPVFEYKRCFSFMPYYLKRISTVPDYTDKKVFRLGRRADMYRFRTHAHNGSCPRSSAVFVRDHLRFIYYNNVIFCTDIQHLDRRRLMQSSIRNMLFFTCQQTAQAAVPVHCLILFESEESERCQVDSGFRFFQVFYRGVSLSGICRADMEHEMPLYLSCQRV